MVTQADADFILSTKNEDEFKNYVKRTKQFFKAQDPYFQKKYDLDKRRANTNEFIQKIANKNANVALRDQALNEFMEAKSTIREFWPVVIMVVTALLLIGPGFEAFKAIFMSLNLWAWLGFIVIGIMIIQKWR